MSDTFPFRHADTGLVQNLTPEAAEVFGDKFQRLPEGHESMTPEQLEAHAALEATLEDNSPRSKAAREAKAAAEAADAAAAGTDTKDA